MKKYISFICLSLIIFLLGGCSKKERWKGNIDYYGNVKVVKNPEKGMWEEAKSDKMAVFQRELTVGTSEDNENKSFHQPMDVIADNEGNIYVLDTANFRIQKFDKDGNYLLTISRKGQGPGEILNSMDIEFDKKGNVLVFDSGNNRITKFDPLGNLLNSFRFEFTPYYGVLDSDDNIYVFSRHNGCLIHKYTSDGTYLFSFMDEIKNENKRIESHQNFLGRIGMTADDRIYLILAYPYIIYIHNTEGELLQKIITPTPYAQPIYLMPSNAIITNFVISGITISPQGYIFCRNISFDIPDNLDSPDIIKELASSLFKKYSYVDIFDPEGRFLIHQHTQNFSWGSYFDNKGYYYGIEEAEDYFMAARYSIKFK